MTISRVFSSVVVILVAAFLGGCAAQQGGFNANYQGRHGGIAIGGSGSNVIRTTGFAQSAPIAVLSNGGYVVPSLDGNACPGGYQKNSIGGWYCTGGQVQMGQHVLRQNQFLIVPQDTGSRVYVPGSCQVGGKDFGDISEDSCLEIRKALNSVAEKKATQPKSYGKVSPKTFKGNTCAVTTKQGDLLADFLDSTRNPKGVVVTSGTQCQEEKTAFMKLLK